MSEWDEMWQKPFDYTAMNGLGTYAAKFVEWRKMLASMTTVELRIGVFTSLAEDVAGYVSEGLDKTAAVDELQDIATASGLVGLPGGADEVQTIISDAFAREVPWREERSNGHDAKSPQQQPPAKLYRPISSYRDAAMLPPRKFTYAKQYICGAVSTTIADGGTGKTNLAISEAIAIATGKNILGVPVPERANVLYWNGEEPIDEIERRVHAVCQLHSIDVQKELTGRLFIMSGLVDPIVLATMRQGAAVFDETAALGIEQMILRHNIGVAIFDPFVSLHRVPENDNTNIDAVVKRCSVIAFRTWASLEMVHHTRKQSSNNSGADFNVGDSRGATALVNAARTARVLNRMTSAQAQEAGVTDHRIYFRADNGKANYAPAQMATWFELVPQHLANGDSVAALKSFKYPGPFDGVMVEDIDTVRALLLSSKTTNRRHDSRSAEWVGFIIAQVCGLNAEKDRAKLVKIIDGWIKERQLFKNRRKDPQSRKLFWFVDGQETDADGCPINPDEPSLF